MSRYCLTRTEDITLTGTREFERIKRHQRSKFDDKDLTELEEKDITRERQKRLRHIRRQQEEDESEDE